MDATWYKGVTLGWGWKALPSGAEVLLADGAPRSLRFPRETKVERIMLACAEVEELTGFPVWAIRPVNLISDGDSYTLDLRRRD